MTPNIKSNHLKVFLQKLTKLRYLTFKLSSRLTIMTGIKQIANSQNRIAPIPMRMLEIKSTINIITPPKYLYFSLHKNYGFNYNLPMLNF